jgi:hypothetical protein
MIGFRAAAGSITNLYYEGLKRLSFRASAHQWQVLSITPVSSVGAKPVQKESESVPCGEQL